VEAPFYHGVGSANPCQPRPLPNAPSNRTGLRTNGAMGKLRPVEAVCITIPRLFVPAANRRRPSTVKSRKTFGAQFDPAAADRHSVAKAEDRKGAIAPS